MSATQQIEIENENDALKAQMKSLQLTIQTYQDENSKIMSEKEELIKQMNDLREKSEEAVSKVFLKSDAMTNFKQELNRLTEDNINYKKELNDLRIKYKEFERENNELKEKNIKYEKSLNESRLNENILTQKLSKQSVELLELKNILQEFQTKYDHLFIENSTYQQENEQLKDTADEIQLITRTNNANEPSSASIKWRYKKTITNAKMEECLNDLHFEHNPSITITPSNNQQYSMNMITPHRTSPNIISPNIMSPHLMSPHNITPRSVIVNTILSPNGLKRPFVYNFECADLNQGPFMVPPPPPPSNLPLLNISSGFDEIEESPNNSPNPQLQNEQSQNEKANSLHETVSIKSSIDCDQEREEREERDELEREWRKKCEDLKAENDSLRKLCEDLKKKKKKDKIDFIKQKGDKVRAYELKTSRYGCNGYFAFNCFPNKGMKEEDE